MQNDLALSYHKVRGLYFLAVVFVRSIVERISRSIVHFLINHKSTKIGKELEMLQAKLEMETSTHGHRGDHAHVHSPNIIKS